MKRISINYLSALTILFFSITVKAQITYTNLGPQVYDEVIQGSTFYEDNTGKKYVYTVVRGEPAHLLGYDLADNSLVTDLPITGCSGAWDIKFSSTGVLYIASGNGGFLFSHVPKTTTITNHGRVLGTESNLWVLAADDFGNIYGGTYPGCKIFKFNPTSGYTDYGNGALVTGENYVRSLVYHKTSNKFYAGIGSHASLIEYNPVTHVKRNILPAQYNNESFVGNLGLVNDLPGGDRLLVGLSSKVLIYNIDTDTFEGEYPLFTIRDIQKSAFNNEIYYTKGGKFFGHDITGTGTIAVSITSVSGSALTYGSFSDGSIYALTSTGEVLSYNSSHCTKSQSTLTIASQPIKLNFLHKGPDQRIWTGGYLRGTNAAYNPSDNTSVVYKGLNQTESVAVLGSKIYFGTYGSAIFHMYDTSQPWVTGTNPKNLGRATGQDRPFGGIGVPAKNKVFFGTVPAYGQNGGELIEFDANDNNKLTTYGQVVANHSIITLAYQGGKIFGGTSIWGGLGINPVATEAKLFVWDVDGKTKLHEFVPVAGAKAITCLINGNDGNIWGIAAGTLFKVNPSTYQVVQSTKIYNDTRSSHLWRPDHLVLNPKDNNYYGIINSQVFRLDNAQTAPVMTALGKTGNYLTLGPNNEMYYTNNQNLWKMELD